jgi:hypothetical protein
MFCLGGDKRSKNKITKYYKFYLDMKDIKKILKLIKKGYDPNMDEGILYYIINNNDIDMRKNTDVFEKLLKSGCELSNTAIKSIIENNRYIHLDYLWKNNHNLGFTPTDLIHRICNQVCYYNRESGEVIDVCLPVFETVRVFVKYGADLTKKSKARIPMLPVELARQANHKRVYKKQTEFGEVIIISNPLVKYLEDETRFQENIKRTFMN